MKKQGHPRRMLRAEAIYLLEESVLKLGSTIIIYSY